MFLTKGNSLVHKIVDQFIVKESVILLHGRTTFSPSGPRAEPGSRPLRKVRLTRTGNGTHEARDGDARLETRKSLDNDAQSGAQS
jgi:hypothetical protein